MFANWLKAKGIVDSSIYWPNFPKFFNFGGFIQNRLFWSSFMKQMQLMFDFQILQMFQISLFIAQSSIFQIEGDEDQR